MHPSPELRAFLSDIAIFGGLFDPTLERIIAMLEEHRFPAGATICQEGEPGRTMYVVRAGEVVVCRRARSGAMVRMVRLGAGEFFGEMALIDVQPRSAAVIVESDATLFALTNAHLYALYTADRDGYIMVIQNLCRELSRRLRKADAAIVERADDAGDEETQIRSAPPWFEPDER